MVTVLARVFPWIALLSPQTLRADALAGLTGAVMVLPQGVAYATIAGLPPQYGLYAAIVAPVVAGLAGSSRHMVSGPTAAISVLVASVLAGTAAPGSSEYITLALTLTFLAGLFQFVFGLARLGALVNFISHTVVVGFTAAAAIIIALSQVGNAVGVQAGHAGAFVAVQIALEESPPQLWPSLALFALTMLMALVIRRLRPAWPATLLAMVVASALAAVAGAGAAGVPMVGAIPGGLPSLSSPAFSPTVVRDLVPGALAVAVLGLIEAVSISRAIALRSRQQLDSNREFFGQGLSNIAGSFASSYAASGSFTRSGVNYDAGARTPLAAVAASLCVAVVVLAVPGATAYLPVPVVAAVILQIARGLVDTAAIRQVVNSSRQESVILAGTFLAGVAVSLEFAIAVGVVLSLVLYLHQTSHPRVTPVAPHPGRPFNGLRNAVKHGLTECPHLRVLRVEGSLFFGAAEHVQRELQVQTRDCKQVLLVCSGVNFIDLTGAEMLAEEATRLAEEGGALHLCGLRDPARRILYQGGYEDVIGADHIYGDPASALEALAQVRDGGACPCEGVCVLGTPNSPGAPVRR